MATLVQIDFPFPGPFGEALTAAVAELAQSIRNEPGLVWKIWTENARTKEAGGIYVFSDDAAARAYVDKHRERLKSFGITSVNVKTFDINEGLTRITNGPVA